eukprot:3179679-Rhodomonas_salina.1
MDWQWHQESDSLAIKVKHPTRTPRPRRFRDLFHCDLIAIVEFLPARVPLYPVYGTPPVPGYHRVPGCSLCLRGRNS